MRLTNTTLQRLHGNDDAIAAAIADIKSEMEFLRRPRRRIGRYATVIIVAIAVVAAAAFAARADDAKQPTELQQIHQDLHDMYVVLADQADALAAQQQALELEISRLALACSARKPPHPPVWSEPQ